MDQITVARDCDRAKVSDISSLSELGSTPDLSNKSRRRLSIEAGGLNIELPGELMLGRAARVSLLQPQMAQQPLDTVENALHINTVVSIGTESRAIKASGSSTKEARQQKQLSVVAIPDKPATPPDLLPPILGNAEKAPIIQENISQDGLQTTTSSSLSTASHVSDPTTVPSEMSSHEEIPAETSTSTAQERQETRRTRAGLQSGEVASRIALPQALSASPKRPSYSKRNPHGIRPRSSIPLDLTPRAYASQCVDAAESSRLNPHALHEEEYEMLREHISRGQVTTYLNIRNGILRLWLRRPSVTISKSEALGCAKDSRWFDAAGVCFDWLVRRGYINYGCIEVKGAHKGKRVFGSHAPRAEGTPCLSDSHPTSRKKTIAVIGAGMAGLGCARQLHNLFEQYGDTLTELDLETPDIVVLEGRNRVGGRVYSRPFRVQPRHRHTGLHHSRCTAEMGGMIVTGFDRGNPMNTLIRGQLGLGYHTLLSTTTIYDTDGKLPDARRDRMVEDLFNMCLDRVSEYKFKVPTSKVVEGNREYVDEGRDYNMEGYLTIASEEKSATIRPRATAESGSSSALEAQRQEKAPQELDTSDTTRQQEYAHEYHPATELEESDKAVSTPASSDTPTAVIAAVQLKALGWTLKPGVDETRDIDLDLAANTAGATLGFVIEEAIKQFGELVDLNAQDFRLLNWHIANLEYSNAINHNCLSLFGWDIDTGNEWEGGHSMVAGGYQSVPRGLMLCPTPLDVRCQKVVKKVSYPEADHEMETSNLEPPKSPIVIEFEDGSTFEADYVVNTIPLGVLKYGSVEFDPPLPAWKADPIYRLGYGVLNKIILTYRQPFWDTGRDIFGVLREPTNRFSLDQAQYSKQRGRMFQWFNVSKTTGMPCLVALMAGDAAFDTERVGNDKLVAEATSVLRSVFGAENVPEPIEAIVTRWSSDKFSRGSYSSAGPTMQIDDYDAMARPVGKHLHFAGEHTIRTHPATVHGAYLSGLRAASDIFEELVGPIKVTAPLVPQKDSLPSVMKRKLTVDEDEGKAGDESSGSISAGGGVFAHKEAKTGTHKRLEAREARIQEYIFKKIGARPQRPPRVSDNPYMLFSKANYERAHKNCEEGRRPGKGPPTPNDVRAVTSKMWRSASSEERLPYAEQAAFEKQRYDEVVAEYNEKVVEWDRHAVKVREEYDNEQTGNGEQDVAVGTPQSLSPSVSDLATATPDRPSPGGGRLLRTASYQAVENSDVDMSG